MWHGPSFSRCRLHPHLTIQSVTLSHCWHLDHYFNGPLVCREFLSYVPITVSGFIHSCTFISFIMSQARTPLLHLSFTSSHTVSSNIVSTFNVKKTTTSILQVWVCLAMQAFSDLKYSQRQLNLERLKAQWPTTQMQSLTFHHWQLISPFTGSSRHI